MPGPHEQEPHETIITSIEDNTIDTDTDDDSLPANNLNFRGEYSEALRQNVCDAPKRPKRNPKRTHGNAFFQDKPDEASERASTKRALFDDVSNNTPQTSSPSTTG